MDKIKIMVADSHEVVRLGISFILRRSDDFEVVAEAATCSETIVKAEQYNPDVIIMDVRLADESSTDVCRTVKHKHPQLKVVMLVSPTDESNIFNAITAGADGLLPKQIKSEELTRAVKLVKDGQSMLDPSITTKVLDRFKKGFYNQNKKEALLNPQERRILGLIAQGKTNKEIAQVLMLSNNTIKNYVSGILSKLNFSNRAEAAAYAVKHNLHQLKTAN